MMPQILSLWGLRKDFPDSSWACSIRPSAVPTFRRILQQQVAVIRKSNAQKCYDYVEMSIFRGEQNRFSSVSPQLLVVDQPEGDSEAVLDTCENNTTWLCDEAGEWLQLTVEKVCSRSAASLWCVLSLFYWFMETVNLHDRMNFKFATTLEPKIHLVPRWDRHAILGERHPSNSCRSAAFLQKNLTLLLLSLWISVPRAFTTAYTVKSICSRLKRNKMQHLLLQDWILMHDSFIYSTRPGTR